MDVDTFRAATRPKYHGTKILFEALRGHELEFFIMLSSVTGLIGSRGQANYVAGNVYQDMFAQSRSSDSSIRPVAIDFPLIEGTRGLSTDRIQALGRQGLGLVKFESLLPVMDYVMSGRAARDGRCHVIVGINAQGFVDAAQEGRQIPPMFGKLTAIAKAKPTPRCRTRLWNNRSKIALPKPRTSKTGRS